jgi:hypothetical protein
VKPYRALVVSAMAMISSTSIAAPLTCTTKVNAVRVHPNGALIVNFAGMGPARMCYLGSDTSVQPGGYAAPMTLTVEMCRSYLAMAMTAKSTQENVLVTIDYPSSVPSCTGVFNWTVPNPYPTWVSIGE